MTFWSTATDQGPRSWNEDRLTSRHGTSTHPDGDHGVAVMCDGLGSQPAGEVAADIAARTFLGVYGEKRIKWAKKPRYARIQAACFEAAGLRRRHGQLSKAFRRADGLMLR